MKVAKRLVKLNPRVFLGAIKVVETVTRTAGCCYAIRHSVWLTRGNSRGTLSDERYILNHNDFFNKVNRNYGDHSENYWWSFTPRGLAARKRALQRAYVAAVKHEKKRKARLARGKS